MDNAQNNEEQSNSMQSELAIKALIDKLDIPNEPKNEVKDNGSDIRGLNMLSQTPAPEALELIPEEVARKYTVIPISLNANTLKIAMANPSDVLAISALAALTRKRIELIPSTEKDVRDAIDFNYKATSDIAKQFGITTAIPEVAEEAKDATDVADDSPVARALNLIVNEAVKSRASDIHIEPEAEKLRVRYRIDGILHDITTLPIGVHGHLISRIKILSGMNIADHLRPQDGQFSIQTNGRDIDIRVATINTVHGEMSVLRLLDKSMAALSLSQLGFLSESRKKFEQMLAVPHGMVLISGPTGAGKTTTLYAAINSLDKASRNIITTEDPVEYRFRGINQIQVNQRAGLTFASALRSILRLDPDVILVGEVRDSETAQIAVQSALTGHLVLSSVHANDTVGVLFRLLDLGIEPFLISSAVIGIVAQRMVRRICPHCSQVKTAPVVEQLAYLKEMTEERREFSYGAGCKACAYTGYLGRTGVFEILPITDELRKLIVSGAGVTDIKECALKEGMITLARDGMIKAGNGLTTPYEVLRNVYSLE
jgi:general secretion pathway protein E